jgi:hypothetical protein
MKVTRAAGSRYEIDGRPLNELSELEGAVTALKKPIPIVARRVSVAFTVETSEGTMSGKAGDWLMQGIAGELYICPAAVFEQSYDIIGDPAKSTRR